MIGAGELSESAKALEMAAKEKREEFITENHYGTMNAYSNLAKGLFEAFPDEIQKAEEAKAEKQKNEGEEKKSSEESSKEVETSTDAVPAPEEDDEILEFSPVDEEGGEEK